MGQLVKSPMITNYKVKYKEMTSLFSLPVPNLRNWLAVWLQALLRIKLKFHFLLRLGRWLVVRLSVSYIDSALGKLDWGFQFLN